MWIDMRSGGGSGVKPVERSRRRRRRRGRRRVDDHYEAIGDGG